MQNFAVVIADIKASRKLTDRKRYEWQLFLKSAVVQINESFSQFIEAPFMITKGDEFQGVLRDLTMVDQVLLDFERLVYPVTLRFGIGYGPIQRMGSIIPIEMDGMAFHRADKALQLAKKKKVTTLFSTIDSEFDLLVNTCYSLINNIKSRWSKTTCKRYWKYKELGTYKSVASEELVSPQAVWDSLNNSGAADVLDAEKNLTAMFNTHFV